MPPMKYLCLHGAGTNSDIFRMQLEPVIRELSKDNSAEFFFLDGEISCGPGPGVAGFFEPPYYSYFNWPRSVTDSDSDSDSVEEAYNLIYETLRDEGPFTGIIGFSHGATLAFGFLVNHAKTRPLEPICSFGLRCAIFLSSMAPFRQTESGQLLFDDDMGGYLDIPSLCVAGRKDFLYEHSLRLSKLCSPGPVKLLVHNKGHEVPGDRRNVHDIASAMRQLAQIAML